MSPEDESNPASDSEELRPYTFSNLWLDLPPGLDPDEVTKRLGIEPDHTSRCGDPRAASDFPPKTNRWCLGSGLPHGSRIGEHIEGVLAMLRPVKQEFREIAEKADECYITFNIALWHEIPIASEGLPDHLLRELGELGDLKIQLVLTAIRDVDPKKSWTP